MSREGYCGEGGVEAREQLLARHPGRLSETGHVGRGGDYQVRTLVDIILKQNIH